MPTQAKGYIGGTIFVGLLLLAAGLWGWTSTGLLRYLSFLLLALFASTQKFRLPGIRGTMSAAFVFVLIAIADFSFGETMVMACSTALVQSLWKARRRNVSFQVLFNQGSLAISAAAAYWLPRLILKAAHYEHLAALLLIAATLYYGINTLSVLAAVALVEDKPLSSIWRQCSLWSYSYFLIYAVIAGVISASMRTQGWVVTVSLIVLPILAYATVRRLSGWLLKRGSDRRREPRYGSMNASVEVIWTDRNDVSRTSAATIVEISASGIRVESKEPISASTVRIKAREYNYSDLADVRWCEFTNGTYVVGMEFHCALNKDQLLEFLYARAS